MRSLVNMRGMCRMCGERLDTDDKAMDIFETGPDSTTTYATLLKIHLDIEPQENDEKPRKIGETCAKLLEEWTEFKRKILETQKDLLRMQQRRAIEQELARDAEHSTGDGADTDSAAPERKDDRQNEEPSTSETGGRVLRKRKRNKTDECGSSGNCRSSKRLKK